MTRPKFRRTLRLETLESRELLSSGGPTDQQQYMLELLNEARTNPAEMADKVTSGLDGNVKATIQHYNVDLDQVKQAIASSPARPPLAWNDKLAAAAQGQSQDQANTGKQSHNGSDGSDLGQRLDRVGYDDRTAQGENAFAYSTGIDEAMEAFLIDWGVSSNGHRENILQPKTPDKDVYREVGVGIVKSNRRDIGPLVITQNFGAQADEKPDLLGVAYNDPDHTDSYKPGQGRGDVTIEAKNVATGKVDSVNTWNSGGYQIPLDPGTYKVTARVGDQVVRSQDVVMGTQNVKVDYDLSEPWQGKVPDARPVTPPPPPVVEIKAPAPPPPPPAPPTPVTVSVAPTTTLFQASSQPDTADVQVAASVAPTTTLFQANSQPDTADVRVAEAPPTTGFDFGWTTWTAKKS